MSIRKIYKVKVNINKNINKNSNLISQEMQKMGESGKIYEAEQVSDNAYYVEKWFFNKRDLIFIDEDLPDHQEPQLFDVGLLDI